MNYLDNAATTLVKPRAVGEAVHRALTGAAGYARGGYAAAQRAGDLVYDCREQAAALFGLYDPSRVIFTQNATHALNIAIHALARPGMKVAVSGFEHNAVMRPLALHGIDPAVLHTPLWQPERMVQEVRRALGEGTELFILNHVSNVFGAVCPLDEIGRLLSAAGVPGDRRLAVGRRSRARCLALSLPRGGVHARSQGAVRPDGDGTAARAR